MRVRKASHDSIAAETDDDFFCFVFAEDLARFLEILLPLHPQWFLPGAALANFIRSGALVGRQSLVNGTILDTNRSNILTPLQVLDKTQQSS